VDPVRPTRLPAQAHDRQAGAVPVASGLLCKKWGLQMIDPNQVVDKVYGFDKKPLDIIKD